MALAVMATAISATAFAADSTASDQSVQAQIAKLKKEIAQLQANQQKTAAQTQSDAHSSVSSQGEAPSHVTVPTNMEQIQNFLFSDVHDDVIPMGMLSSSQFALGLLKQRNAYNDHALIFGGYLEADAQAWNGGNMPVKYTDSNGNTTTKNYKSGQGIYITTASLYTAANLGRYVSAELTLTGDQDNAPSVNDALVMFGNLDDYPLYATIGKNRIPLGSFAGGGPWTGSLTKMLFRPGRETNASLAYYKDGLSTNITVFNTDDNKINASYAAFYGNSTGKWSYGISGGYVYDVNGTGNSSFSDAYAPSGKEQKRIGAVNFDTSLNYDIYGVGAGWAQTTKKADETNKGYGGAWYISAGLSPEIYGRSTNFSVSYNGAYNTNDTPITLSGASVKAYTTDSKGNPIAGSGVDKMVIASVQRPFFTENVLLGLEYAYMHMYYGQHSNAYTLDVSVYF